MAVKAVKQAVETTTQPETVAQNAAPIAINEIAPTDIEALIADEILDNLDWQKVRESLIARAKQRFWVWLSSQILSNETCQVALTEIDAIAMSCSEVIDA